MQTSFVEPALLIHGDCLKALKGVGPCDHFIFDPPYEKHMHDSKTGKTIRKDGHRSPRALDFDNVTTMREPLLRLVKDKCTGWLIAFCTPEGVAAWRDAIEASGIRYKRALFWIKPDAAPQFNGQGPAMAVECMVAAWCGKGYSNWNGGGRSNVFEHSIRGPLRDGRHPTEKPIPLMIQLVALFTNPGEVICDPYMGSGSTGVAALRLGRRFVGIERKKNYYDIARHRIASASRQGDLFIPTTRARQEALPMELPRRTNGRKRTAAAAAQS